MVTWETIINLVITSLLVIVTYLLARYTKLLYRSTSDQERHIKKQTEIMGSQLAVIEKQNDNYKIQTELMSDQLEAIANQTQNFEKQTKIMNLQASYAEKQTEIMDKQVSFLKEQREIMEEDREFRMLIEKYRRLRDEMDKLVAPLYVNSLAYTDRKPGNFQAYEPGYTSKELNTHLIRVNFWNDIQKNLHLSQSENLSEYLQKHFDYNLEYINSSERNKSDSLKTLNDNAPHLIKAIKERHGQLKSEIEEVEKELGMRKRDKI